MLFVKLKNDSTKLIYSRFPWFTCVKGVLGFLKLTTQNVNLSAFVGLNRLLVVF